jgi:pyridoxamine 5'-phosphate oxidase
VAGVADDPVDQFLAWFAEAVTAGVPEPHAMTVSTTGPTVRIVLCKDVRDGAWEFATDARSAKATAIARDDAVALTFWWQPLGRQVRLAGHAVPCEPEVSAADFRSRSLESRAAALATRPGQAAHPGEVAAAIQEAARRLQDDPDLVLETWTVYRVVPDEVEFWQGRSDRAHVRLVYRREGDGGWDRQVLFP